MAKPIPETTFRREDFPGSGLGSKDALDKFFLPQNAFTQSVRQALNGNLTFGQNMNAEIRTISVATPSTDWVAPSLAAGVSNYGATYETAAYRKDAAGIVHVRGLVKTANAVPAAIFTLPSGFVPAQDFTIATISNAGAGDVFGRLDIKGAGNAAPGLVQLMDTQPSAFGSIKCSFPCSDGSPGVLSRFPLTVNLAKVTKPQGVVLIAIADAQSSGAITPAPGSLVWAPVNSSQIQITNIPGLPLGRTYNITILVIGG